MGLCLHSEVAVHVFVGFGEDDEIQVDLEYPVFENNDLLRQSRGGSIFVDGGLSERELKELESLILDNSDLLDTDVPKFAHIAYDFLHGLSPHASLVDPLYEEWVKAKAESTSVSNRLKVYVPLGAYLGMNHDRQ